MKQSLHSNQGLITYRDYTKRFKQDLIMFKYNNPSKFPESEYYIDYHSNILKQLYEIQL
jgi:uncharacterized protein YqkB